MELTINNDYDYKSNKLIPKLNPNHSSQKLTTSIFAFSKAIWEPRVEFYQEKSVLKLKDKDWEAIMNALSKYLGRAKEALSKGKGKVHSHVPAMAEEELELKYDSDSNSA